MAKSKKVEIAQSTLTKLRNNLTKAKAAAIMSAAAAHSAETSLERQKARFESFKEELDELLPSHPRYANGYRPNHMDRAKGLVEDLGRNIGELQLREMVGIEKDCEIEKLRQTIMNMAIAAHGPETE